MTRPWLVSMTSVFCASTGRQSAGPGPVGAAVAEAAVRAASKAVATLFRSMSELGEQPVLDPGGYERRDIAAHLRDLLHQPRRDRLVDRIGHQKDGLEVAV